MDLLGEDANGKLHHFELQSRNDRDINFGRGEYKLGTRRLKDRFSKQVFLYVGEAPLNMPSELVNDDGDLFVRYRLIDIRELDGEALLASPNISDKLIAILARLRDRNKAIRGSLTCQKASAMWQCSNCRFWRV